MAFTSLAHHIDIDWMTRHTGAPARTGPLEWTGRRRRTMPRAHRRGACLPAGRAQRGHREPGRRDHDGADPRPQAAGARHRGRRRGMRSGSVIVDMAASALGGNCELSQAGETVVTENGVTIVAPENLPATMPVVASAVLRPEHLRPAPEHGQGREPHPRLRGGGHQGDRRSRMAARSCPRRSGSCWHRPEAERMSPEVTVFLVEPHDLRARDHVRVRGHLEGAGDAAHAADVGRQLDPRHRARRGDVHRRRGRRPRSRTCCRSSPSRSRR